MDPNINIPLVLISQLCSTRINHQLNRKLIKINILLIGGQGGGKSTLLDYIKNLFENVIRIEREGKFTPQGYMFNTLKNLNNDILISQIPEISQNSNIDSYDTLKQLHDGELISSTKKDGRHVFSCNKVYITACANKLDYIDLDSQAVINRYVVLFLPNDNESSFNKVYGNHEEITLSEKKFLVLEIERTIKELTSDPLLSLDINIIKKYARDLQANRPNIDFLEGCRIITQFNTLVSILKTLLKISLEESCVFTKELLLDNYKQLDGYIHKSKRLSKSNENIYANIDSKLKPFFQNGSIQKKKIIELIYDALDRKYYPSYIERRYYKGYKELYLITDNNIKKSNKQKGRKFKYFKHKEIIDIRKS